MRWPRRRRRSDADDVARAVEPVVLPVTTALTRTTALDLARRVERLPGPGPVVIDLTGIPAFDSDGAEVLLALQEADPQRSVSIVGLRQAAARLVAPDEPMSDAEADDWVLRRLRNLLVVQPARPGAASGAGLTSALASARLHEDAAIVVVDLLDVGDLPPIAVQAVAFASSHAALQGQELLIVNASVASAEALRAVGLSATTYVAPESPL